VTGLSWTTALGDQPERVWRRLLAGESGLAEVPCPYRLRSYLAAAVPEPGSHLPPSARLRLLGSRSARRALADAQISVSDPGLYMVFGTSFGAQLDDEASPDVSMHTWVEAIAADLGVANEPLSLSTACSSGTDAILVAAELIRSGVADRCLCGAADVLTTSKRLGHSQLATMSPTYLRAFDQRHDGTLLGEGAGCLVIESHAHAAERGAPIYALLRGTGSANDASSLTAPDGSASGARLALKRALLDAGVAARDVAVINAHGSGTPLNDRLERDALEAVFGGTGRPLVFATKGAFGHTLGATGAIEAIAVILALRTGSTPPIVGLDHPDPDFRFPLSRSTPAHFAGTIGLSLTLGFGGFDSCVVFEGRV
jgi:3-oxoacyl-[acyl-carrier-protein] synthase II